MKTAIWIGLIAVVCVQAAALPGSAGQQAPAQSELPASKDGKLPQLPAVRLHWWMDGKSWSSRVFFEEMLRTADTDRTGC